jgi:hypothetical protein
MQLKILNSQGRGCRSQRCRKLTKKSLIGFILFSAVGRVNQNVHEYLVRLQIDNSLAQQGLGQTNRLGWAMFNILRLDVSPREQASTQNPRQGQGATT